MFDNRAELREEIYSLWDVTSDDAALTEQGQATNEVADRCLQYGLWATQLYLIGIGAGERWRKTSATLSFTGSDETGGCYVALPSDCLRVAGDEGTSALRTAAGVRWGRQINERDRFDYRGRYFYLLDDSTSERLWLAVGAGSPTDLVLDYYEKHPTLGNDTGADSTVGGITTYGLIRIPELHRGLVAAEAAFYGMHLGWFPGGPEQKQTIADARTYWRDQAAASTQRTRQPKRTRQARGTGTHWFV